MSRLIGVFVLGGLFGLAGGFAAGLASSPFVFSPPAANETLAADELTAIIARGRFIRLGSLLPIRDGSGGVTVLQRTVFLESDFAVRPNPGLRVYLVPKEAIRISADLRGTEIIDLGPLRAFQGSQKYAVPLTINLADYPSVVIWSDVYNTPITSADLSFL